ncbi:predicted protein [Sclerotinia sclerotiorum 1980 UF-70]|uniref:Uncharacterized protein n=1 Tax=Sclerotinia sclerotiorum (strain ATCC 18683 / 1980 / Ss-1) TaxID=665079 RepID=A7E4N5_SCLS1|nr:predicted protein [Sclerotinia sclerotiorum 1980 UF-70]EDN90857.1 predicted protein [Sclerotinia sclerotiorum 1980 UF-70]
MLDLFTTIFLGIFVILGDGLLQRMYPPNAFLLYGIDQPEAIVTADVE